MDRPSTTSGDLPGLDRRTERRRAGDAAEARVAEVLADLGWAILARQVHVGRAELDIVALDPGPPASVVVVEVRSRRSAHFGCQEDRVDDEKVRRLYRAAGALRSVGRLPDGRALPPGLEWRVDLVAFDAPPGRIRHLRGLLPR